MRETTIDVDGIGVAIRDEGAGRPIVLLHGGSRTLADWLFVWPFLVEDFRLVSVDFRGHGRSDAVPSFSIDEGVADTAAVVDALGLDDAVIVGHSLGGMTAVRYGARISRCAAIVNVDGFGTGHPSELPGIDEDEALVRLERWAALSEEGFRAGGDTGDEAWMEAAVAQMRAATESMGLDWATTEPLVRRGYRQLRDGSWQTSPSADVNASMYRSLFMVDHWADYDKLSVPTLVIRSTNDDHGMEDPDDVRMLDAFRVGIEEKLAEQAARRPDFEVEHVATGHMVMWEEPAALAASIRRFIAAHLD